MNVQPNVRDDPEAEIATLALAIHFPRVRKELADIPPSAFHNPLHRRIRGVILEVGGSDATPIPLRSIESHWPTGEFGAAEGERLLQTIWAYCAALSHWDHYRRRLLEAEAARKALRGLEHLWTEIVSGSRNGHLSTALQEVDRAVTAMGAQDQKAEPFPLVDLAAELPAPPAPLVGNDSEQLVGQGEKVAVVGDPEAGKTNLLLGLGLGIGSGREVLGFPCLRRPVAYVTSDGDPDSHRRLIRIWKGLADDPEAVTEVPMRALEDDAFNISDLCCLARVRVTLEALGAKEQPAVLIVESLATNVPDSEVLLDQARFREYARLYGELQAKFPGLTILVSAHFRKPQQKGANDLPTRIAGTMQIRAAFDAIIGVVGSGQDSCSVRRVKRSRSGGNFRDFSVRFLGDRDEPLRLHNAGPLKVSVQEARGAAAVMHYFRTIVGPKPLKDVVTALSDRFKERAVQAACRKLADTHPPFLKARGTKPLSYERAEGDETEEFHFGGLD